MLHRPEACAAKLELYISVTEKLFLFNGLFAAADRADVSMFVGVQVVESFLFLCVRFHADLFEFVHIPTPSFCAVGHIACAEPMAA